MKGEFIRNSYFHLIMIGAASGLFYAGTMALFDYFTDEEFQLIKFIFNFIIFGFLMAFSFRNRIKK